MAATNPFDFSRSPLVGPAAGTAGAKVVTKPITPTPIGVLNYASLTKDTPGLGLAGLNLAGVNAARSAAANQAIPQAAIDDFNKYIEVRYGGKVPAQLADVAALVKSGKGANAYTIAAAMEQDAVLNPADKKFVVQGPAGTGISLPNVVDVNANDVFKTNIPDVDANVLNLVRSGVPLGSAFESQRPGIDYATMLATTKKKYGGESDMAPTGPGPFGAILSLANPVAGALFNAGASARNDNPLGVLLAGIDLAQAQGVIGGAGSEFATIGKGIKAASIVNSILGGPQTPVTTVALGGSTPQAAAPAAPPARQGARAPTAPGVEGFGFGGTVRPTSNAPRGRVAPQTFLVGG